MSLPVRATRAHLFSYCRFYAAMVYYGMVLFVIVAKHICIPTHANMYTRWNGHRHTITPDDKFVISRLHMHGYINEEWIHYLASTEATLDAQHQGRALMSCLQHKPVSIMRGLPLHPYHLMSETWIQFCSFIFHDVWFNPIPVNLLQKITFLVNVVKTYSYQIIKITILQIAQ